MTLSNSLVDKESVEGGGIEQISKLFLILILTTALIGTATATEISSERDIIELGDTTEATLHINYTDITSKQISTLVPASHQPSNVRGSLHDGEVDCRYIDNKNEIICDPAELRDNYSITIKYSTPDPTDSTNGYIEFNHISRILTSTDTYSLKVLLPEGYGLIESEDIDPLTPDAETSSEGRKIHITWKEKNPELGSTLEFTAKYQELNVLNIFPGYTAIALTLVLILVAGVIAFRLRSSKEEETISSILPILKEDEREVLMHMVEKDGECEQKDLVENLDYSKAKISRLVKNLKERNLIEKIKEGRKNRLTLKRKIGEIEEE